jgi:hypothetical protein
MTDMATGCDPEEISLGRVRACATGSCAISALVFPHFFKPQRLKYQSVVFLVHDVIKHFIFPYFFKLQRLQCNVTWFSSTWRYKTFHFPVLFSRTFSNHKVWNTTLLAFLVHDVIKHFIFPYFFKPQRLKCNIICFSSTWGYKTFHFPVLLPRTFSNRNVWNTTLFSFLVHDVIKHFIFPYFFPVLFQTATFEIQRYLLF